MMSTAESEHWEIKQKLESSLEDLKTVIQKIQFKLNNQLQELHLLHKDQKAETILSQHSASVFQYLCYEVSTYAIEYMYQQWEQLTKKLTCLTFCTRIFWITMSLLCKHEIQILLFTEEALKRDHLHSHWWLNSLAETQSVNPVTVIQNPIQVH